MPISRQLPDLPAYVEALIIDDTLHSLPHSFKNGKINTSVTITYTIKENSVLTYATESVCENPDLEIQALIRQVMARWSAVANIKFVEGSTNINLYIQACYPSMFSGYGSATFRGGRPLSYGENINGTTLVNGRFTSFIPENVIYLSLANPRSFITQMQGPIENYSTLLHEIGHVLGFSHPFENKLYGQMLEKGYTSKQFSVLNYETSLATLKPNSFGFDRVVTNSPLALTPSYYDIKAAQFIYGPAQLGTGDDVYNLQENLAFAYQLVPERDSPERQETYETLWDPEGIDTLSCKDIKAPVTINLNQGPFFRSQLSKHHFFALAGSFENIIGGEGQHEIILNKLDNVVDLRKTHKASSITTAFAASGNDAILGFNPYLDTLVIETHTSTSALLIENFNSGSVKITNETVLFNYSTLIRLGSNNTILLANIDPEELSSQNLQIKLVSPDSALQRQRILANGQISFSDILCSGASAFSYSALTAVSVNLARYIMQDKLHLTNATTWLTIEAINTLLALTYAKSPSTLAHILCMYGIRFMAHHKDLTPKTQAVIALTSKALVTTSIFSSSTELTKMGVCIASSMAGSFAGNKFSFFASRGIERISKFFKTEAPKTMLLELKLA